VCKFEKSWIGVCQNPGEPLCKEHKGVQCVSCGNQATHDCGETGQFVCCQPLCDDCEHTIHEDGTNGGIGFNYQPAPEGMKAHCKRVDQKHVPWYMQSEEARGLETG
jgi:hypothetical protein